MLEEEVAPFEDLAADVALEVAWVGGDTAFAPVNVKRQLALVLDCSAAGVADVCASQRAQMHLHVARDARAKRRVAHVADDDGAPFSEVPTTHVADDTRQTHGLVVVAVVAPTLRSSSHHSDGSTRLLVHAATDALLAIELRVVG